VSPGDGATSGRDCSEWNPECVGLIDDLLVERVDVVDQIVGELFILPSGSERKQSWPLSEPSAADVTCGFVSASNRRALRDRVVAVLICYPVSMLLA
jgi:hypothetical protein